LPFCSYFHRLQINILPLKDWIDPLRVANPHETQLVKELNIPWGSLPPQTLLGVFDKVAWLPTKKVSKS
jgi:hypothetical protein